MSILRINALFNTVLSQASTLLTFLRPKRIHESVQLAIQVCGDALRAALSRASLLLVSCAVVLMGGCIESQHDVSSAQASELAKQNKAFIVRFDEESDLNKKWRMLEAHSDALQAEKKRGAVDDEHSEWIEREKETLLAQLPEDHPAKVIQRAYSAIAAASSPLGILDEEQVSTLAASVEELMQKNLARGVGQADFASLSALEAVANLMIGDGVSTQRGEHLPAFETLHQVCVTRHDLELSFRLATCATASVAYFQCGKTEETAAVMKEYAAITLAEASAAEPPGAYGEPNLRDSALLNYGWYLFEIGRQQDVLALVKKNGGAASTARAKWLQLAGWADIALRQYSDAEEQFKQALDIEDAKLYPLQGSLPRAVRNRLLGTPAFQRPVTPLVVDLYIAQSKTNPPEAAKIPDRYVLWQNVMRLGRNGTGFGDRVRSFEYSEALRAMNRQYLE